MNRSERRRQQRWAQDVMRRAGIALKANVRSCDTPWARDDAAWFAANPERAHRVRPLFEGELQARRGTIVVIGGDLELPKEDDCVVLVRQVEPGLRVSMVLCGTFGEPIPDIEAIVHAAFDLLARKATERAAAIITGQPLAQVVPGPDLPRNQGVTPWPSRMTRNIHRIHLQTTANKTASPRPPLFPKIRLRIHSTLCRWQWERR
jgi:hypothetical protein